jgi:hypothetical protein
VIAVFNRRGKVALVLSTLGKHRAGGIHRGTRIAALRQRARPLGERLWVRRARGGKRFVFRVRRGRVAYVGVASRSLRRPPALRRHLRLAGLR